MRSLRIWKKDPTRQLPVVIGSESAECAIVCMTMIGRFHGHDIDLNALRSRFSVSITGITLRSLMSIAEQLQFSSRAIRTELESLSKVALPAILHWNLEHFVVLKAVGKNSITIHDPNRGALKLSLAEASRHFSGIVLELTPVSTFQPLRSRRIMRISSLWSDTRGMWRAGLQILGLSVALQCAAFVAPIYIQLVTDDAISRRDVSALTAFAVGFAVLWILQTAILAIRDWTVQTFGNLLTYQITGNIVRHILRLPTEFFEKRHIGDILSRVNSTSVIEDALTRGLLSAIIDGAMAIVAIAIMVAYSKILTIIVLVAVVINSIAAACLWPRIKARNEEQLVASATERSHLMESIRAASTIKLMGREAEREGVWRNHYVNAVNAGLSATKLQIGADGLQNLVTGLSNVAVIYVGARFVIAGDGMTLGMLMAFLSFRQTFSDRVTSLISQSIKFKLLGLHIDRIGDIVAAEAEPVSTECDELAVSGALSLHRISFNYGTSDPLIIDDLTLSIEAGEFIAIIGPSGGGKTTLLKLILGLRQPTDGQIYLDGRAATPALTRQWREHVGVVSQEDRLLSGSIAENIAFFSPDLDMDRVIDAARRAQVHEDIWRMPMRYFSLVGDMGSALSGGQKQRILLARALYRNPKILILDEGTANLDEETENLIADLVRGLEITRIVVAHRPALIRMADRVIKIGGEIELNGHEESCSASVAA